MPKGVKARVDTKTPTRRPSIGTKITTQPSPGVKSRQTPIRVTTAKSRPSDTDRDSEDDEKLSVTSSPATGNFFSFEN